MVISDYFQWQSFSPQYMCKVNNKREPKTPKKNEMLSCKMVLGSSSVGKKIFPSFIAVTPWISPQRNKEKNVKNPSSALGNHAHEFCAKKNLTHSSRISKTHNIENYLVTPIIVLVGGKVCLGTLKDWFRIQTITLWTKNTLVITSMQILCHWPLSHESGFI